MDNEDKKGADDQADGQKPDYSALEKTVNELSKKHEDLNKGIAAYRDEAQLAKREAAEAKAKLAEFEKKVEFEAEDDPSVRLAEEDEKKLKVWADQKGFVTQDELQAERAKLAQDNLRNVENTAIESFLTAHPDADKDENWAKIQAEFKSWYRQPQSLTEYKLVLNKIYKDLFAKEDEGYAKAKAEIRANQRLTLGGGSQRSKSSSNDSEDVDSLMKRYPNLTRDQIEEQLSEISNLPKRT